MERGADDNDGLSQRACTALAAVQVVMHQPIQTTPQTDLCCTMVMLDFDCS